MDKNEIRRQIQKTVDSLEDQLKKTVEAGNEEIVIYLLENTIKKLENQLKTLQRSVKSIKKQLMVLEEIGNKDLITKSLCKIQELINNLSTDKSKYSVLYTENLSNIKYLAKDTNKLIDLLKEFGQIHQIPENINLDVTSLVQAIEESTKLIPQKEEAELTDEELSENNKRKKLVDTLVDLCRRQHLISEDVVKKLIEDHGTALQPEEIERILNARRDRTDTSKTLKNDNEVLTRDGMAAIAGKKEVREMNEIAGKVARELAVEPERKDVPRQD